MPWRLSSTGCHLNTCLQWKTNQLYMHGSTIRWLLPPPRAAITLQAPSHKYPWVMQMATFCGAVDRNTEAKTTLRTMYQRCPVRGGVYSHRQHQSGPRALNKTLQLSAGQAAELPKKGICAARACIPPLTSHKVRGFRMGAFSTILELDMRQVGPMHSGTVRALKTIDEVGGTKMDSEQVTRRGRKVRSPKAARSALNKVGRLGSTNNHPKRPLSRSRSYDAGSLCQGIRWKCDTCGFCGTIFPGEEASITSLVSSIQFDHAKRSPQCSNGHDGIQIVPRKVAQQWLSSSSA
jgi:hypothetical protein